MKRADDVFCLHLVWFKWDLELLESTSKDASSIDFSLVIVPPDGTTAPPLRKSRLDLSLKRVFEKIPTVQPPPAVESAPPAVSSPPELPRLERVQALYASVKDRLPGLCLSPFMLDMLGYNHRSADVFVYGEGGVGIINEQVQYISSDTFTGRREVAASRLVVVEEGEEAEEAEEAGPADGALAVCAVDCEMCETSAGSELTRGSVVSPTHGVLLDTLVKPLLPVISYNTAFSGITKELLAGVTTTIHDVHSALRGLISADTILVGHSLDNDLNALKLHHARVIDTAALFPQLKGLPMKQSLKRLAEEVLHISIRADESATGHDSVEDAYIALELVLHRAAGAVPSPELTLPCYGQLLKASILDGILDGDNGAGMRCCVFGCGVLRDSPDWERASLGYRPEADICSALDFCAKKAHLSGYKSVSHSDCYTALDDAVRELKTPFAGRRFVWVDMPFVDTSRDIGEGVRRTGAGGWVSLASIDDCLREVYAAIAPRTLMVVVTQGDVVALKALVVRKQLNKWDPSRVAWDDKDEQLLIQAAAQCLSGCMFLKRKL